MNSSEPAPWSEEARHRWVEESPARADAVARETWQEVDKQHIVSRAVLRRFLGPSPVHASEQIGKLAVLHPERNARYIGPDGVGYSRRFVGIGSGSAERLWKNVEDKIPMMLEQLDSDIWPLTEECRAAVKDVLALHYARSHLVKEIHERSWNLVLSRMEEQLRVNPAPAVLLYLAERGLHVVGRGGEERAIASAVAPTVASYESGVFFRLRVEDHFKSVRRWLEPCGVEVTKSLDEDYIISDAPLLAVENDAATGVLMRDVGLARADQFMMPIDPRIFVSLSGRGDARREASSGEVRVCNYLQIDAARSDVFFRPAMEEFVRDASHARREQRGPV